jgi:hypothetical protein
VIFVEFVKAVAWPGAVLLIVWWLKEPLGRAIDTLQKLKYKDLELEFEKKIEKLAAEAEKAKLPDGAASPLLQAITKGTNFELAVKSPKAAIAEAFDQFTGALRDLAARKELNPPQSLSDVTKALQDASVIDPRIGEVINDLLSLRNDLLDADNVPPHIAIDYVTVAKRFEDHVRSL